MVVVHPFQESDALGDLLLRQRRGRFAQPRHDLAQPFAHLGPVLDGGADVGEDGLQHFANFLAAIGRLLADLDVHEGFVGRALARLAGPAERRKRALRVADQPDDRVDDQVDLHTQLTERRGHRIDQERHVVVDDLDDGMGRLPALFLGLRVVDPDLAGAGRPGLAVAPQGQGGAIEVVRILPQDIVRRHVGVELAQEVFRGFDAGRLQTLAQAPGDPIDQVVLELFRFDRHDPVPPLGRCPYLC